MSTSPERLGHDTNWRSLNKALIEILITKQTYPTCFKRQTSRICKEPQTLVIFMPIQTLNTKRPLKKCFCIIFCLDVVDDVYVFT